MATPVDVLRDFLREDGKQERKCHRNNVFESNRGALGEVSDALKTVVNEKEVAELANKLKHKGQISLKELTILKHACIHSEDNIAAFLKVNGALHALVRELSGTNTLLQLAAVNCCCNLALGNHKLSLQVTKTAAPYLLSSIDGLNNTFLDACVWTLGNLAGSGIKSWTILKSQGLLMKLIRLVTSVNSDIRHSAIYALTHYVKTGFDRLDLQELELISSNVSFLLEKHPSSYWLVYLLSCSPDCNSILLKNLILSQTFELLSYKTCSNEESKPIHETALLRLLANLCGEKSGDGVQQLLSIQDAKPEVVQLTFNSLLTSPHVHIQCEALWLLGNIFRLSSDKPRGSNLLTMIEPNLNRAILQTLQKEN